jgi:hypothetical protein
MLQRIAPFRFIMVSIHPMVIVMQPHDYGPLNRPVEDLLGAERHEPGTPMFGLINPLHFGTQLPASDELWWLSPDLKVQPTKLDTSNGIATIPLPDGQLVLSRNPTGWQINRR